MDPALPQLFRDRDGCRLLDTSPKLPNRRDEGNRALAQCLFKESTEQSAHQRPASSSRSIMQSCQSGRGLECPQGCPHQQSAIPAAPCAEQVLQPLGAPADVQYQPCWFTGQGSKLGYGSLPEGPEGCPSAGWHGRDSYKCLDMRKPLLQMFQAWSQHRHGTPTAL